MPFVEHLRELRIRLRNAVIALAAGFVIAYSFKELVLVFMLKPLTQVWAEAKAENPAIGDSKLVFGSLVEPFWTYFSMALWAGIFVASPFIFYQIWKFIAPGLYKKERKFGVLFATCSALSFVAGALFCYFLVLPQVFEFLLGYSTRNLAEIKSLGKQFDLGEQVALLPLLSMQEYLSFARKLLLGFGLVFELPLAIFFMSLIGLVTHRGLWKFNRWWIVLSFVISAILTPPDVISQTMMAGPLVVLYNLSIIIAWIVTKRREARLELPTP